MTGADAVATVAALPKGRERTAAIARFVAVALDGAEMPVMPPLDSLPRRELVAAVDILWALLAATSERLRTPTPIVDLRSRLAKERKP